MPSYVRRRIGVGITSVAIHHLPAEVSCDILGRLGERKERRGGIFTHDLLQLVDLFGDFAKSGLRRYGGEKRQVLEDSKDKVHACGFSFPSDRVRQTKQNGSSKYHVHCIQLTAS